jgi:hypothetical protein
VGAGFEAAGGFYLSAYNVGEGLGELLVEVGAGGDFADGDFCVTAAFAA